VRAMWIHLPSRNIAASCNAATSDQLFQRLFHICAARITLHIRPSFFIPEFHRVFNIDIKERARIAENLAERARLIFT
jgi:hypothetical protein